MEDATWYEGRPQPSQHYVRLMGTQLPKEIEHRPQFLAHVCFGQMARWIKMPLGSPTEVGRGPVDIVLDGGPRSPKRGTAPNFRPMSIVAKRLDGRHLVRR